MTEASEEVLLVPKAIRVEPDLWDEARRVCEDEGTTISADVRKYLRRKVKRAKSR